MTGDGPDELLLAWLQNVEALVQRAVEHRRADDPLPEDPFRGLYISEDAVDRLMAGSSPLPSASGLPGLAGDGPLARLARAAPLTALDVLILTIAMLPDLDGRFERLYGYLNDDVTRRRATIGLTLELAGQSALAAEARRALSTSGTLVANALVLVEDTERPFLTRALRVPDRVTAHLLGDDRPDPATAAVLQRVHGYRSALADQLAVALRAGARLTHIREREAGTGTATAVAALDALGRPAVVVDLVRWPGTPTRPSWPSSARGRRCSGEPVWSPDRSRSWPKGTSRRCGCSRTGRCRCCWWARPTGTRAWTEVPPLVVEAPVLGARERVTLLQGHLDRVGASVQPEMLGVHVSLGPPQLERAVRAAQLVALLDGGVIGPEAFRSGVRGQNASGLERLARRIEPEVGWADLVLASGVRRSLEELSARARHRGQVLVDWRMRRGGGRGRGVTALFAGDSGTGKTMSAEVIAADLALDLYTVNLATVVDKYVGETEKNLERIFSEAGGVNAVLFFDEADAIFGKRSDVRDAHDRYANIESAYLLQRLETFDGLAVLATNLRANIDDAFTRRLDAIIDFPAPTPDLRERLWHQCLAAPLPVGDDVDVAFCAGAFELAGGNIRSAATTAAYLAAEAGTPVSMAHVVSAVEQEYRKLGRLVLEKEFGQYIGLLA